MFDFLVSKSLLRNKIQFIALFNLDSLVPFLVHHLIVVHNLVHRQLNVFRAEFVADFIVIELSCRRKERHVYSKNLGRSVIDIQPVVTEEVPSCQCRNFLNEHKEVHQHISFIRIITVLEPVLTHNLVRVVLDFLLYERNFIISQRFVAPYDSSWEMRQCNSINTGASFFRSRETLFIHRSLDITEPRFRKIELENRIKLTVIHFIEMVKKFGQPIIIEGVCGFPSDRFVIPTNPFLIGVNRIPCLVVLPVEHLFFRDRIRHEINTFVSVDITHDKFLTLSDDISVLVTEIVVSLLFVNNHRI